ncbi:DUF1830 domain-containing protein [Acaryochloris marina]|uniref:DUF1830 domain-containing protein n=1 Tax=Acaryochloris marina TaxID=155978 RepID=UPI001BAEFEBA|nr:DUF1830 domain-containing protein [Acaryochloris marina]QUY45556.1 DUF1830 domain-containing protein [Acaryochloris marina S15]
MQGILEKPDISKETSQGLRCRYANQTSNFQIIRIVELPNFFFERVVCPGQQLVFEANLDSQLEVHSGSLISSVLSDTIPCCRLALERIKAKSNRDLDKYFSHKVTNDSVLV